MDPIRKLLLCWAVLGWWSGFVPCPVHAGSADSPNIRVDTRARNLVSLSLAPVAPAVLAGGSVQFSATALYDDASSEDVTNQAFWQFASDAPRSVSLVNGMFSDDGGSADGTRVRVFASLGAGTGVRVSSTEVSIAGGLSVQIRLEKVQDVANSMCIITAHAIVTGATSWNTRWDLNEDGFFGDKTGDTIQVSESPTKRAHLWTVEVQSGTETKIAAVRFTMDAAPDGSPVVVQLVDAFSAMLLDSGGGTIEALPSSTAKLAVVIHGLENSGTIDWVQDLCDAIQRAVPEAVVVAYDWKEMADPSMFQLGVDIKAGLLSDAKPVKPAGRVNGILLSERLLREQDAGHISTSTRIHLIGHSAGGFVAGECARRLYGTGFSNVQVTMLDTPLPYAEHINRGWPTDRYASSWYGGRFQVEDYSYELEKEIGIYNFFMDHRLESVAVVYGDAMYARFGEQSGTARNTLADIGFFAKVPSHEGFAVIPGPSGMPSAEYLRVEIEHPRLSEFGADDRHGFAHAWYQLTVGDEQQASFKRMNGRTATIDGHVDGTGFSYSILTDTPPSAAFGAPASKASPETVAASDVQEAAPPPLDLDGFTYFGAASGSGGVQTLAEDTDAGFWKEMTMPVGAATLRFRYRFTTAGDGDFLAAYWGEEELLVIAPDTDSARAGFVDMEADVSRFGGQTAKLVFKLTARHLNNAVAEVDQIQIELSDDPDQDGLTNAEELALGTNAHLLDTDGDGLADYDEAYFIGTNPRLADSDGDGVSDADELSWGTDPLDFTSAIRPRLERGTGGLLEVRWQGVMGRSYSLLRSADLDGTAFDFVAAGIGGGSAECVVADPYTTANPRGFYWIIQEP